MSYQKKDGRASLLNKVASLLEKHGVQSDKVNGILKSLYPRNRNTKNNQVDTCKYISIINFKSYLPS